MKSERIGIYELYQKIKEYNMDFFPLNNEVYYIRLFTRENFFVLADRNTVYTCLIVRTSMWLLFILAE